MRTRSTRAPNGSTVRVPFRLAPRAPRGRRGWAAAVLLLLLVILARLASDMEPLAIDDRARAQLTIGKGTAEAHRNNLIVSVTLRSSQS